MTRNELVKMAKQCMSMATIMCRHESGQHIWSCHRECQWCHSSYERWQAAVVAEAYLTLVTGLRYHKNLQPGDSFVADMGQGCNKDESFVVKSIYPGRNVHGDPVVNIDTTCNEGLTFGMNDKFSIEELNHLLGIAATGRTI